MSDTPASPAPATTDAQVTIAASATPATPAAPAATPAPPAAPAPVATAAPAEVFKWPENWRQQIAGNDAQELKRLERFTDPAAYWKSYRQLEAKLSSGELKSQLPKDATPEQLAAWRKENGIPDKPEDYVNAIKLPDGLVIGENDKPLLEGFAKVAQEKNWTPAQYNDAVSWFFDTQDKLQAQREEADQNFHIESQQKLMEEMGKDYKANLNAIGNMTSTWPEGVTELLFTARTPDGRLVGDHPAIVKALAQMAREVNPAATLIPVGTDSVKGVSDRIAEIEKMQYHSDGRANEAYWRSESLQKEYRDLLEARGKLNAKAA